MSCWIVVPVHNGLRWLSGLVDSIETQTSAPESVLFVDDGSTDGSGDWLTERGWTVLRRPVASGFAKAANAGLEHALDAGAGSIALINMDVELDADWIARTVAALDQDPTVGSVACKMVRLDRPELIDDAGNTLRRDGVCEQRGHLHLDTGQFDHEQDIWGACAGAALYRADTLRSVGLFDERLQMYLEDVDLALRMQLAGWRCRYVPAIARHAGGGSGAGATRMVARNTLLLVARWYPLRWIGPVAYRQVSWLVAAARGRKLIAHLRGLAAGTARIPGALRARLAAGGVSRSAIEDAVPDRPWRGPAAGGHEEAGE